MPDEIVAAWRAGGTPRRRRRARTGRSGSPQPTSAREFERRLAGKLAAGLDPAIDKLKRDYAEKPVTVATRKASELALDVINAALPETIGGSADLTPSNNTKTKGLENVAPGKFGGRYIHYGIREHGMAAAMNGMALHGGLHPLWRHVPDLLRLLPPVRSASRR